MILSSDVPILNLVGIQEPSSHLDRESEDIHIRSVKTSTKKLSYIIEMEYKPKPRENHPIQTVVQLIIFMLLGADIAKSSVPSLFQANKLNANWDQDAQEQRLALQIVTTESALSDNEKNQIQLPIAEESNTKDGPQLGEMKGIISFDDQYKLMEAQLQNDQKNQQSTTNTRANSFEKLPKRIVINLGSLASNDSHMGKVATTRLTIGFQPQTTNAKNQTYPSTKTTNVNTSPLVKSASGEAGQRGPSRGLMRDAIMRAVQKQAGIPALVVSNQDLEMGQPDDGKVKTKLMLNSEVHDNRMRRTSLQDGNSNRIAHHRSERPMADTNDRLSMDDMRRMSDRLVELSGIDESGLRLPRDIPIDSGIKQRKVTRSASSWRPDSTNLRSIHPNRQPTVESLKDELDPRSIIISHQHQARPRADSRPFMTYLFKQNDNNRRAFEINKKQQQLDSNSHAAHQSLDSPDGTSRMRVDVTNMNDGNNYDKDRNYLDQATYKMDKPANREQPESMDYLVQNEKRQRHNPGIKTSHQPNMVNVFENMIKVPADHGVGSVPDRKIDDHNSTGNMTLTSNDNVHESLEMDEQAAQILKRLKLYTTKDQLMKVARELQDQASTTQQDHVPVQGGPLNEMELNPENAELGSGAENPSPKYMEIHPIGMNSFNMIARNTPKPSMALGLSDIQPSRARRSKIPSPINYETLHDIERSTTQNNIDESVNLGSEYQRPSQHINIGQVSSETHRPLADMSSKNFVNGRRIGYSPSDRDSESEYPERDDEEAIDSVDDATSKRSLDYESPVMKSSSEEFENERNEEPANSEINVNREPEHEDHSEGSDTGVTNYARPVDQDDGSESSRQEVVSGATTTKNNDNDDDDNIRAIERIIDELVANEKKRQQQANDE